MTGTHIPGFTSLRPLDQCFNWYWNSKTDHLWLYFRYYINLLYLLSCYCIVFVCLCMSHYRVRFIEVAIVDVRHWGTHYIFRAGPNITCISNLRLSLCQMIYHMINVPFKEVHYIVVLTCTCLYRSVLSGHKSPTCTQQAKD
mgnify:CR=1 FL=1